MMKLTRYLPFLHWAPELRNRDTLRADLVAGLTGAIVVLPQGVAFAAIAGMPPAYGLYAAMVPAIIAALFGSSRHLVSGPTTAASIVLFSALSQLAEPGSIDYIALAITLTFLVGVTQLVMGLARMGSLVNFISHSVIIGFTAGAALLIATSQLRNFFGVDIHRSHDIISRFQLLFEHSSEFNYYAVAVGSVTLIVGILNKRYFPKIPYLLTAMFAGTLFSVLTNGFATAHGHHIETVAALPAVLPPLSMPQFDIKIFKELAPAILATTLFALTEAVAIARSLAARSGQTINGNQEFIAQGLSNIGGSFFSAYVATGSFNRSGINYAAGAKTPFAAIVAGVLLIGMVPLIAPLAAYLPKAAMAGLLFLVAWGLIDWHHIFHIAKASRKEFGVLIITFAATLFLELEFAILLGVLASLFVYLNRTAKPHIYDRVPDPESAKRAFNTRPGLKACPQLRLLRLDGSVWFGAVNWVNERIRAPLHAKQKHLLLLAQGINFVDVAGAEFFAQEAVKRRKEGGGFYMYGLKPGVCGPLTQGDYFREIGAENTFDSKTEALATIIPNLDHGICAECSIRCFKECASLPRPERPEV